MNATESAKAKARSMSSPKIRPRNFNTCSERYSPYIRINSNPLLLLKWQVVVGLARLVISSKSPGPTKYKIQLEGKGSQLQLRVLIVDFG